MAEFYEFVIQGQPGWTFGFVQGYLRGRGETEGVLDAEAEGFQCESLRERIRELIRPSSATLHLLGLDRIAPAVMEAVDHAVALGHPTELVHTERIVAARFSFSTTVYSREHGERIQAMFKEKADGVTIKGEMTVKVHPEAKGVEMYAPVHEYELKGEGVVEGPVDGVLDLHRRSRGEELISLGGLALVRDGDGNGKGEGD